MGQRSIRFPDELEARLLAASKADGRTFSNFVVRTLESALRAADGMKAPESVLPHGGQSSSAPSRASVKKAEVALEVRDAVRKRNAEKVYSCPRAGCIYVSGSPGVCVHHRAERLR